MKSYPLLFIAILLTGIVTPAVAMMRAPAGATSPIQAQQSAIKQQAAKVSPPPYQRSQITAVTVPVKKPNHSTTHP